MRLVLAGVLAALFSFGAPGGARASLHGALAQVAARVAAFVPAVHRAALARASRAEPEPSLPAPVRVQLGRKVVVIPRACADARGRYDVLVHFHGAPVTIEPAFAHADLPSVFVVLNLGVGSGPYEQAFISDGSLGRLLLEVDSVVQKHCRRAVSGPDRVALSAWSAGYGAVYRILANRSDRERVDAVLLADGLHAGFLDKLHQKMNEQQMAPFTEFARLAARGEKLMAITHTAIVPPGYASTTETANFLVEKVGLEPTRVEETGERPSMRRTSRVDHEGFHVWGYAGRDTDAHCDHLYAIGDTLFPLLKRRWATR